MKPYRVRNSFTLTELIVVVIIICVVTAMLIPHRCVSREKARRVNCAGNMKQIGLALLMYSGENDGYFITTANGNNFQLINTETILNDGNVYGCTSSNLLRTTARHSNYD